jgi:cyclic pyranopterin phosphate synthase
MLATLPAVTDLSLTTNGVLLDRLAGRSSRPADAAERLARLAPRTCASRDHAPDALDRVLAGLEEAERYPSCGPIKVNCVAMRGFTEVEVPAPRRARAPQAYVVRFIEFMPLDADQSWRGTTCSPAARSRADRGALAARGDPGETVLDRPPLPLRRRAPARSGSSTPFPSRSARCCDRIRLIGRLGQLRTCLSSRRDGT